MGVVAIDVAWPGAAPSEGAGRFEGPAAAQRTRGAATGEGERRAGGNQELSGGCSTAKWVGCHGWVTLVRV